VNHIKEWFKKSGNFMSELDELKYDYERGRLSEEDKKLYRRLQLEVNEKKLKKKEKEITREEKLREN
jgi:hypothetical protein